MLAKPHIIALALGLGLLSNGMEGAIAQPVAGEGMRGAIAQNTSSGYPTPEAAFLADVLESFYETRQNFSIDPIAQSGDYAIAGIVYGEGGGVSIAHRVDGLWNIICGTGGSFGSAYGIQEFCNISQPEAQSLWSAWLSATQDGRPATVFDPPSNVRSTPNGEIVCSINEQTTIMTYGETDGWYYTDACGGLDVIHSSQIRF